MQTTPKRILWFVIYCYGSHAIRVTRGFSPSYLAWSLPVTWQRWRSHQSFDPPYPKTPRRTQNSRPYLLQNRSYCRAKFYITGIGNFVLSSYELDLDAMTFIYEHDPYSPYSPKMYPQAKNKLSIWRLSKVIVLHIDIHTGWQKINRTIQPFDRVYESLHKITPLHSLVAHRQRRQKRNVHLNILR